MRLRLLYLLTLIPLLGCDEMRPSKIIEKTLKEEMAREDARIDSTLSNPNIFDISITENSLQVKFRRNDIYLQNVQQLDSLIKRESVKEKKAEDYAYTIFYNPLRESAGNSGCAKREQNS